MSDFLSQFESTNWKKISIFNLEQFTLFVLREERRKWKEMQVALELRIP